MTVKFDFTHQDSSFRVIHYLSELDCNSIFDLKISRPSLCYFCKWDGHPEKNLSLRKSLKSLLTIQVWQDFLKAFANVAKLVPRMQKHFFVSIFQFVWIMQNHLKWIALEVRQKQWIIYSWLNLHKY